MFWHFFSLSSFWNIPVTFKMALKYYSCLSECLHGDLFILLPNLLVYVKVCGLACDFVRVHDLRADDIVRHFNGLSFLVVWLLNDASPYNFLSTTLPLDVAPVCVYMFCVNDCVCKIKSCGMVWCGVVWCTCGMMCFLPAHTYSKEMWMKNHGTVTTHCWSGNKHLISENDDKEMIFGKDKHAYTIKKVWFFHEWLKLEAQSNLIGATKSISKMMILHV